MSVPKPQVLAAVQDSAEGLDPVAERSAPVVSRVGRAVGTGLKVAVGVAAAVVGTKYAYDYAGDSATWLVAAIPAGAVLGGASGAAAYGAATGSQSYYFYNSEVAKAATLRRVKIVTAVVPAGVAAGLVTGLTLTGTHIGPPGQMLVAGLVGAAEAFSATVGFGELAVRQNKLSLADGGLTRRASSAPGKSL